MKGKPITFRPKDDHRVRLDDLAEATDRPVTWFVEKCIEANLPALEKKYAQELRDLAEKRGKAYPSHRPQHITVEDGIHAKPAQPPSHGSKTDSYDKVVEGMKSILQGGHAQKPGKDKKP